MDYEDALKYPARGDWVPRIAIGGGLLVLAGFIGFVGWMTIWFGVGLLALPLLALPRLVVDGYHVQVLRRSTHGSVDPPEFDDLGDVFVDGLRAMAINLAYLSPVILGGVVLFGAIVAASAVGGESEATELAIVLGAYVGIPLLGLASIAIGYVRLAGLANFAYEDDLWAAFDVDAIREVTLTKEWAIAWFVAWAVTVAGGLLSLGSIGYLLLFGFFVEFYVATVAYHVHGRVFAEIKGESIGPAEGPDEDPGPSWESVPETRARPDAGGADQDRTAPTDDAGSDDDGSLYDDW